MAARTVPGVVAAIAVTATAIGVGYPAGSAVDSGADLLRLLLFVCAFGLVVVGAAYTVTGHAERAVGHLLAGSGLAIAAAFASGVGVWIGVVVAAVGGVLLVRDALTGGRRRRPIV